MWEERGSRGRCGSQVDPGCLEINKGENQIIYSNNCKINGVATTISELKQNGSTATMENIFPGINKIFDFGTITGAIQ